MRRFLSPRCRRARIVLLPRRSGTRPSAPPPPHVERHGLTGYDQTTMSPSDLPLDIAARAREKEVSRQADALALANGDKTAEQLREENEVFASLAPVARADLSASRSLG